MSLVLRRSALSVQRRNMFSIASKFSKDGKPLPQLALNDGHHGHMKVEGYGFKKPYYVQDHGFRPKGAPDFVYDANMPLDSHVLVDGLITFFKWTACALVFHQVIIHVSHISKGIHDDYFYSEPYSTQREKRIAKTGVAELAHQHH